jgi:hypothetical protein
VFVSRGWFRHDADAARRGHQLEAWAYAFGPDRPYAPSPAPAATPQVRRLTSVAAPFAQKKAPPLWTGPELIDRSRYRRRDEAF